MDNTPHYIFESSIIKDSYNHMKECLKSCDVYYALKSNGEKEILQVLNSINAKFEIASTGELNTLKELNVAADRIICSLPVKKAEMIKEMYNYGCRYFVFDSTEELNKIRDFAPKASKILRIYINDIVENTIPFGMEIDEIDENIKENSNNFINNIDGVTFYLRKNYNYKNLEKVLLRCEEILKKLNSEKIKYFNIGGNYRPENQAGKLFYEKLNNRLNELAEKYKVKLIAEVGRSVVKFAGKLYTRVELVKHKGEYSEIFIDAGLPTGISYAPKKIRISNRETYSDSNKYKYKFYGITCCHSLLFEIILSYEIQLGDMLEFFDFGSYSISKHSNFHGWEKPKIILK